MANSGEWNYEKIILDSQMKETHPKYISVFQVIRETLFIHSSKTTLTNIILGFLYLSSWLLSSVNRTTIEKKNILEHGKKTGETA